MNSEKRVDLVFRTIGERTSALSLDLAKRFIQPQKVHVLQGITPFRRTVEEMLRIEHDCDAVVHMDADCLIFEDMRPFLNWNDAPHVDCYVHDRFRGAIHCGVHITRIDIVREMAKVTPADDDMAYVLRPESRTRNLALKGRSREKRFKGFHILHDHHQSFQSIWEKYALRDLRSRVPAQRARLDAAMAVWGDEPDFHIARDAIAQARAEIGAEASTDDVQRFIIELPSRAKTRLDFLGLKEKGALERSEVVIEPQISKRRPRKVFGLGLSRTGTRSLTRALHTLGIHCVHYPVDEGTLADLERGDGRFRLLEHFDGLTDITASPYFAQLDQRYPGSKFILTTRPAESWLRSVARHWSGRPAYGDPSKDETHLRIRRFLRAAAYGCFDFAPERFAYVYAEHERRVRDYFAGRPDDLLILPLTSDAGWEPLCDFLNLPVPFEPFPHKGGGMTRSQHRETSLSDIHD